MRREFWAPSLFQQKSLDQTSFGWFFVRWITHFCAPVFVFLTGMSAWLYEQKYNDKKKLMKFLLSRGLWLLFAEIVFVNLSWQFKLTNFIFLQVLSILGVSMILLAILIHYTHWFLGLFSLVFILGHECF